MIKGGQAFTETRCARCSREWTAPNTAERVCPACRRGVDLDDLEAKARAATQGPWSWWTSCSYRRLSSDATGRDGDVLHGSVQSDGVADIVGSDEDKAHIAAANPAAVLEIVAEVRRLQAVKVAARRWLKAWMQESDEADMTESADWPEIERELANAIDDLGETDDA